ncbi:MAG: porphobilinogen synthase, partial [Synergistaceae bacterium]|nr:porphobilinogen synthase [Synergistaceae bacterium]
MNGFSNIARMRRLRQQPLLAEAVRETCLEARQMILPLFVA